MHMLKGLKTTEKIDPFNLNGRQEMNEFFGATLADA